MSQEIIFYEEGATLTDKQKEEISAGIAKARSWMDAGCTKGSLLGYDTLSLDAPDKKEYKKAAERLENMQVVATEDFYGYVENALAEDKLHLSQKIISQFGDEENALFALQIANANKKQSMNPNQVAMSVSQYIEEPVIFVNPIALENNQVTDLTSVVAYESANVAQVGISENVSRDLFQGYLQPGVAFDKYLDNEQAVYNRLIMMQKNLGLKPHQEFSIDEVQKLREQCIKNGYGIFDRYSNDKTIANWLNYASGIKKRKTIDRNVLRESMLSDAAGAYREISLLEKGQRLIKDYYASHPGLQIAGKKVKDIAQFSKDSLTEFFNNRRLRS